VTALRRDALCRAAEHLNQKQKEHEEGWNIGNSNPSTIDFLPLSVKLGPGRTIYVSYNGGQIHRSTSAGNREPQGMQLFVVLCDKALLFCCYCCSFYRR